jgi:hypothetical protein
MVVMVVMVVLVVVLVVVMVVVTALVVMMMVVFVLFLVMVMIVVTLAVMVVMFVFLFVMVVMVMVVVATFVVIVVIVVIVVVAMFFQLLKFLGEGVGVLHSLQNLLAVKLAPGSGYNSCLGVVLPYKLYGGCRLFVGGYVGVAEHNASRRFHLIVEEFAKILHIHLALSRINNGGKTVYLAVLEVCALNGTNDVRKLAHA